MLGIKTATITWVKYNNYGTLLQCYALQQYIKKLGIDNQILNDSWIKEPYQKTIRYIISTIITRFLSFVLTPFGVHTFNEIPPQSKRLCRDFVTKYLDVDYNAYNLNLVSHNYDCFVCGSDQIWNPGPQWYKKLNTPFYYAGFTSKKKIAYGPSLGVSNYPEKHREELKHYLESFSSLSCREDEGCRILKNITGKEVYKVVDPTLLLDENEWRKYLVGEKAKTGYVLCYFLSDNSWYADYVNSYIKSKRTKLISFDNLRIKNINFDSIIHAGPKEFLKYIDGADFVFTDSFHASLFSALLKTEFVTFERFSANDERYAQNNRLKNFFSIIDVKNRFISEDRKIDIGILEPLDFVMIEKRLAETAKESKNYLNESLK